MFFVKPTRTASPTYHSPCKSGNPASEKWIAANPHWMRCAAQATESVETAVKRSVSMNSVESFDTVKSRARSARGSIVFGAPASDAPALRAVVDAGHHSLIATPAKTCPPILVMSEAALAMRRIAGRQRQRRRLTREKSQTGESERRRASSFAGHDRNRVIRIRRPCGCRRWTLLRLEQLTERPPRRFSGHRSSSLFSFGRGPSPIEVNKK